MLKLGPLCIVVSIRVLVCDRNPISAQWLLPNGRQLISMYFQFTRVGCQRAESFNRQSKSANTWHFYPQPSGTKQVSEIGPRCMVAEPLDKSRGRRRVIGQRRDRQPAPGRGEPEEKGRQAGGRAERLEAAGEGGSPRWSWCWPTAWTCTW